MRKIKVKWSFWKKINGSKSKVNDLIFLINEWYSSAQLNNIVIESETRKQMFFFLFVFLLVPTKIEGGRGWIHPQPCIGDAIFNKYKAKYNNNNH